MIKLLKLKFEISNVKLSAT